MFNNFSDGIKFCTHIGYYKVFWLSLFFKLQFQVTKSGDEREEEK